MDDTAIERALAVVFESASPVRVSGGRLGRIAGCRYPEEEQALRTAADGRVQAFRAGRLHARQALALLGVKACSLPVGSDRGPLWPQGVVGSITHDAEWAAAAAARSRNLKGVGLDVEQIGRITPMLEPRLFTETEQEQLSAHAETYALLSTVMFSVKEALYKAVSSAGGGFLGFQQAEVTADPSHACCRVRLLVDPDAGWPSEISARWSICGRSVLAGIVLG